MLMVAISAPIATLCLMRLGLGTAVAYAGGMLYALSPYALYRQIEHFALVIYLVPIPCTVALLISTGRLGPLRSRRNAALLAGCALVGFNYVYYAFFGCFLIVAGALIGAFNDRSRRALAQGAVFVGAISIATLINLAPTFASWSGHGQPIIVPDKTAAESETYGLKIRQLVSPVLEHSFAPFAAWTGEERRAGFPLETENVKSRLGLLETIGFLLLLAALFAPAAFSTFETAPVLVGASRLTLAAVLLGTVGGFGSVFSLLVSPEIRAYNRLCAFIAFFAWIGLGLLLQQVMRSRAGRAPAWRAVVVLTPVLVIGVLDQAPAAAPINARYEATRQELDGLTWFVSSLEKTLPPGSRVFQLPVTTYLNDAGLERMLPYDHIKPYVFSRQIHWSYPALANAVVRWQHAVGRLPTVDIAAAVASQGFAAIVVDKYGYADDGQAIVRDLGATNSPNAVLVESGRYVALDAHALPKSTFDAARLPSLAENFTPASTGLPPCAGVTPAAIDDIGPMSVRGWAVDDRAHRPAGDVDVAIDAQVFAAFYGIDRPDVATKHDNPAYRRTGVLARMSTKALTPGSHAISFRIVSADRTCFYQGAAATVTVR
jgi:phosphoglycerol transferase